MRRAWAKWLIRSYLLRSSVWPQALAGQRFPSPLCAPSLPKARPKLFGISKSCQPLESCCLVESLIKTGKEEILRQPIMDDES